MSSSNAPSRRKRRESKNTISTVTTDNDNDDDPDHAATNNAAEQQRRREKKRIQNRLSQQSCREKQASYVRQLERFVENIQAASASGADSPSYVQQLQTRLWNCMKENQELREAILQMRKKMLSLSVAASSGADDVIFSQLIFAPSSSTPGGRDHNEHTGEATNGITSNGTNGLANGATNGMGNDINCNTRGNINGRTHNNNNEAKWDHSMAIVPPVTEDVQNLFALSDYNAIPELRDVTPTADAQHRNSRSDPNSSYTNGILSSASLVEGGHMMTSMPLRPPDGHSTMPMSAPPIQGSQGSIHPSPQLSSVGLPLPPLPLQPHPRELETPPSSLLPPPIPHGEPFTAPFYPLPTPNYNPPQTPAADYHDTVVDTIEKQVRIAYENMRFVLFKDLCKTVGMPARRFSMQQINDIDHMTLSDLCKTALRLMLKCSSLEKYSYALGTAPITEKILRWRLHPTPNNRSSIPEPFHPTPLQHLVQSRPASIDFIHWGELRDQLILYRGNYDMRTLLKDTLDSLVREVPSLGIALPVMEYYGKISEIGGDTINLGGEETELKGGYDPNQPYQPCSTTTVQGARRYGLHRLSERKLHEAFAAKYPFLDVNSITTKYRVIPWKEISQYEHLLLKTPSINA